MNPATPPSQPDRSTSAKAFEQLLSDAVCARQDAWLDYIKDVKQRLRRQAA